MSPRDQILFKNNISDIDSSYWEINNNISTWSQAFTKKLGYSKNDIENNLDFFLDNIIHSDDRDIFRDNFYGLVKNNIHFKQKLSIKTKDGVYKEFICKTNEKLQVNIKSDSKIIFFREKKLQTAKTLKDSQFYYRESAEMTSTGSWYVDFIKQKSYWDYETRKILEYPEDYIPSVKESHKYYTSDHRQLAAELFFKCAMAGEAFDTEIKMITANNRVFWVRAIGKPAYNDDEEIIGIRGVFQDIDDAKQKELKIQKNSEIIASKNSRLFNFAHIVSHNLRSHSSNLSLIVELINSFDTVEEKLALLDNIKNVSQSLNTTIEHLNEVVTIQTKSIQHKEKVNFAATLEQVCGSINQLISTNNVTILSDFNKAEEVDYIPAYMDSILLNLVTNAIKYKHEGRDPVINIKTYLDLKDNNRVVLEINDNGSGIDLEKFGDKLFGMYKTFHNNNDAVGIGLFITKNQIESLDGEIKVDSQLNIGTTFTVKF